MAPNKTKRTSRSFSKDCATERVPPFPVERAPKAAIKKLGQNVARLRSMASLTQEKLAEKADITVRHLQKIESGEFAGSFAVHLRLRKALACTWEDLFGGIS